MHVLRIAKILCQNFFTFEVTYISKPKALIDSNNFIWGQNYKVKLFRKLTLTRVIKNGLKELV